MNTAWLSRQLLILDASRCVARSKSCRFIKRASELAADHSNAVLRGFSVATFTMTSVLAGLAPPQEIRVSALILSAAIMCSFIVIV